MLQHKYRFHGHGAIRVVFQNGTPRRGRTMMLRAMPNKNRTHPRVGVVVSKKVYKSAVKRNRIRRRIFEIVRHELTSIDQPLDIVFTVFSPEVLLVSHDDLHQEIIRLLGGLPQLHVGSRES